MVVPAWEGVAVRFDSDPTAVTMVSEWELERPAGVAPLAAHAAHAAPPRLAPALAARLSRCVAAALAAEPAGYLFGDFVSETVAPGYARQVPAQAHLALCLARLQPGSGGGNDSGDGGCFYRQSSALWGDLDRVVANCREFNGAEAPIAEEAAALVARLKAALHRTINDATAHGTAHGATHDAAAAHALSTPTFN